MNLHTLSIILFFIGQNLMHFLNIYFFFSFFLLVITIKSALILFENHSTHLGLANVPYHKWIPEVWKQSWENVQISGFLSHYNVLLNYKIRKCYYGLLPLRISTNYGILQWKQKTSMF